MKLRGRGTGHGYWNRGYCPAPGSEVEDFVGRADDEDTLEDARQRIELAGWVMRQVRDLRKLQFQVADKAAARVLVALHNTGWFAGGLVIVGTLGYMACLNELGATAAVARAGAPPTAVKRAGTVALHVDVLTHRDVLGQVVAVPELHWHAQAIAHYDYLRREPRAAAMLAGASADMLALVRTRLPALRKLLLKHPQTLEQFERALAS